MSSMQGEPICCDKHNVPSKCAWRGNGPDCNGQCHPGERLIQGGSKGGSPRCTGKRDQGLSLDQMVLTFPTSPSCKYPPQTSNLLAAAKHVPPLMTT